MRKWTRPLAIVGAAAASMLAAQTPAQAGVMTIYNSQFVPPLTPLQHGVSAEGYECCQISSFGDEVTFAPGYRDLATVRLTLADFAHYADFGTQSTASFSSTASGWSTPLTFTLYSVGAGNTLGSAIASRTIDPQLIWAPTGHAAYIQDVSFDFSGVTVPDQIVYALSFNTRDYGPTPTGMSGPYDALNFVLNGNCIGGCNPAYAGSGLTAGSEVDPGYLWYDTAGYDLSGGTANTLSQNDFAATTGINYYYAPAARFDAVPEAPSLALFGGALALLGFALRKRVAI